MCIGLSKAKAGKKPVLKQKAIKMSSRLPKQTTGAFPRASGNFSSIYNLLLHEKEDVVFAVHMLFKYVDDKDIDYIFSGPAHHITHDPDVPVVDHVCKVMRFLNQTGRIKYFLTRLEEYADRKGRKSEYKGDYFAEMMAFEGMEYCC